MCLFFSLNKLNDYFPGLLTRLRWRSRINKIPTYFCQISRSLRPTSISFIGKPLSLITSLKLEHGWVQRRMKREDCLHLPLRTYCSFTGRIRLISLSLHSEHYSQNMPLHPSSFPSLSVWRYDISTNTGTAACLHCSCLSHLNAQSRGSEYITLRSAVQSRLSRVRYSVIRWKMGQGHYG